MTSTTAPVSPHWLRLREPADAAARSAELVEHVRRQLPSGGRTLVHDLGCGTGSMGRWLAPRLAGPQHWVLHDRDATLLAHAAADQPGAAADGADVTVETRRGDITRLTPGDLAGAGLVTASALLDILTGAELDRFVTTCVEARCPVLVTLSVVGRVELTPADPVDEQLADAFNAHQRREVGGRRLLGPGAFDAAVGAFRHRGAETFVRSSPWRLGAADVALTSEWLTGWVGAACEQRPELGAAASPYTRRRLAEAAAGRLAVTVHHQDLFVIPG